MDYLKKQRYLYVKDTKVLKKHSSTAAGMKIQIIIAAFFI